MLSLHVFLGMLLIPPVALKLASTGYRFGRYYLGIHKASFLVWFVSMSAHVLAYVVRLPQLVRADFTRVARGSGVALRQLLVAGALVAGVTLAIATLPLARPRLHWIGVGHGHHQEIGHPVPPPAALRGGAGMA